MKTIAAIFRFIGGVTFAVTLIGTTALFVVAGTFLESITNSHRYAAAFTYGSPLFLLLLSLFFVNILVSALRRWPFKRNHVPFLITHLGLLLILSGTIGKQLFGTQGVLRIAEGSGSHHLALSDSYAVEVTTTKEKHIWPVALNQTIHFNDIALTCSQWRTNSRERLEFWVKGDHAFIEGLPALPVSTWSHELPSTTSVKVHDTLWTLHALRAADIADLATCAYLEGLTLTLLSDEGVELLQKPVKELLSAPQPFDGGLIAGLLQLSHHPIHPFTEPRLTLALSDPEGISPQLVDLSLQLGTAHDPRFSLSRTPAIFIVEDAQGDNHLWIMNSTGQIGAELFRRDALDIVIAYRDGFGGYAIESAIIPGMECPVTRHHLVRPSSQKLEDNLPLIVLTVSDGQNEEPVPITFDRYASGMRWPVLDGQLLVRFQPNVIEIPYHLRLHDARQVSYPGSGQPYSYEAIVTVTDRRDQSQQMVTLSMNHVHETSDGYRFYLSHLSPATEESVRQIQIVANHDPVKYWLTYPGAGALSLGVLLLFAFRRPKKQNSQ